MKTSKSRIAGWVLSALLFAFLLFSAAGKLTDFEGKEEIMGKLGWTVEGIKPIGYLEIAVALLFLVPRTAFIGAILLSAYLGGATATHVRVSDPFIFPVILGVVAWVALGLRDPRVFRLAFARQA